MQLFDEEAEQADPPQEVPASSFIYGGTTDHRIVCDYAFRFRNLRFRISFAQTPNDAFTLGLFLEDRQLLMAGAFLKKQMHVGVFLDRSRHLDLFIEPSAAKVA